MTLSSRKKLPHTPPGWVRHDAIYSITICALPRRINHLCHVDLANQLFESIEFNRERGTWWPFLVLLMPDHLHGLISFHPDHGVKKTIVDWKHYTSRYLGIPWQRDFFDHRLRRNESYDEKAAYIRMNPVRGILANDPSDWPYIREWKTRVSIS